jgi:hypothetical protein
MKCTHCGLPLSPTSTSTSCPRCHSSLVSGPAPMVQRPQEQAGNQAWVGNVQGPSWGQPQQWSSPQAPSHPSSPTWSTGTYQDQISFPPVAQSPTSKAEHAWPSARTPGVMYSTVSTAPAARPQAPRMRNLGFIVAALCVISGGLILVFVYFLAMSLPATPTTGAYPATPVATKDILAASPTTPALSPTVVLSPTAGALPGQQYIDNPQMASLVNTTTAQPLQLTTTFNVNQKIYVSFNIHPNGKNGAVCLIWYLNNKKVTQFPFPVTASARAGYSYAIYGGTGPAYVEIYWASSTTCSDKILAQRVNFTVTH